MNKPKYIRIIKLAAVLAAIGVLACGVYTLKWHQTNEKSRISFTAFIDKVNSGEIVRVRMEGDAITAEAGSGAQFHLFRPIDADLSKLLLNKHIDLSAKPAASSSGWVQTGIFLVALVPIFFILKRLTVFNRSKAKLADGAHSQTFFTDVAGVAEAKVDLSKRSSF